MAATVRQGSVFDVLPTLEPGSIDCAVTSPPYWLLRSYLPKGHALKPLELGSEPTPAVYVENMVRVMRLVRDALAPHGTVWLNVGDTYTSAWPCTRRNIIGNGSLEDGTRKNRPDRSAGLADGSLALIPWRLAIALQDDGWLVRSVVVWHKPAPMPASLSGWSYRRCRVKVAGTGWNGATHPSRSGVSGDVEQSGGVATGKKVGIAEWADCPGCKRCDPHGGYVLRRGSWRPTSSWEPVLMLAKGPGYYADGEAVKQPAASATLSRNECTRVLDDPDEQFAVRHDHETLVTTANLRDVWTIPSEPLKAAHYASFPTELVHRCLKAGTSARGYCPACGAPWVRVVEDSREPRDMNRPQAKRAVELARDRGLTDAHLDAIRSAGVTDVGRAAATQSGTGRNTAGVQQLAAEAKAALGGYYREFLLTTPATVGWRPSCPHADLEPRPGRVLDPFAGSCRTGIEAMRLGLDFVGVELSPDYCEMGRRLLRAESPLFAEAGPA